MKHAGLIAAGFYLLGAGRVLADPLVGVTFFSSGGAPQWTNETRLGTTHDLPYETGANSGISLTTSVGGPSGFFPFDVSVDPATIPSGDPNLGGINSNIVVSDSSFTAVLSDLHANATYDVWLFVTRENDPTDQLVTITGAGTTNFTQLDTPTKQLIVNSKVGSSSKDLGYYAVPIVSNGSGDITITVNNMDGYYQSAVSGIAVEAVPEPSIWAMLLIGFAGVGYAGRRTMKRARVALAKS